MKCNNCGNIVTGNFCSNCGQKLDSGSSSNTEILNKNWTEETNYGAIITYPEVRELIKISTEKSPLRLSFDQYIKLADVIQQQFTGFSNEKIIKFIIPISKKYGIGTGKSFETVLQMTVQKTIVKVYCALAKNGYPLKETQNAKDGLIFIAELPGYIWTVGGTILISVSEKDLNSSLEIKVRVEGQLYDWGKSKTVIRKIISDIEKCE